VSLLVEEHLGKWALGRPRTDGTILLKLKYIVRMGGEWHWVRIVAIVRPCVSDIELLPRS
jgi:hypothetical protein